MVRRLVSTWAQCLIFKFLLIRDERGKSRVRHNVVLRKQTMDSINRSCLLGEPSDAAGEHVTKEQKLILLNSANILPGKGPLSTMIMLLTLSERFCRTDHILLLPRSLREFSLTRATLYRSLELLEQAGLVTVKRQRGLSPMVTLSFLTQVAADGDAGRR